MQIFGIFKWKQHLQKNTQEIIKTKLSTKERWIYLFASIVFSLVVYFVLLKLNDQNPLIDSITSTCSVFGLILTVKRCIEQWYVWLLVNGLSTVMWIEAYLNGSNCFATILMWVTYFVLSIYFLYNWKKEFAVRT